MKRCPKCNSDKPFTDFHRNAAAHDGYQFYCKPCSKEVNLERDAKIRRKEIILPARVSPEQKQCRHCGLVKPKADFPQYSKNTDGLNSWCRLCKTVCCRRSYNKNKHKYPPRYQKRKNQGYYQRKRFKTYNITEDQFNFLFQSQGGKCAICGSADSGNGRSWNIDHDHSCCPPLQSCGKCIRGILCHGCNTGLGGLGDNPALLFKAIMYLGNRAKLSI